MIQATVIPEAGIHVCHTDHVGIVEIRRPPHNYFDRVLLRDLRNAVEKLDEDCHCRAIVLCSEGKNFCAGSNYSPGGGAETEAEGRMQLYQDAIALFRVRKPIVAAIQGAAVGGGLGLAMVADFRVVGPQARFSANFARLGTHPGFGLTVTLPRAVGPQKAQLMFHTGDRITGEQAHAWGLADELVPQERVREGAVALAQRIAQSAPLAVIATRATLRHGLADAVAAAVQHEYDAQSKLYLTEDFKAGVAAMASREVPKFSGH